ncbi:unnamed protein product [Phyllotreta striolata]|uniref:Uncharacterized protein n=1 Tax=Phyllotreta striolata TaxID=444603 RepID=A0A9N9TMS7_PHYSR|nr:unnamed protein product [Phyllotreta striolata]
MSTSAPGTSSSRQQKRMGPAPFASFEDLSDEVRSRLESPEDKSVAGSVVRLPGIREDLTPTTPVMTDRSPSPAHPCKGISLIGTTAAARSPNPPKKNNIKPPATPRIDISRASSSSHHDSKDSSPEREIYDAHDPNTAKLGLGFKEDGALDLRSSTEELDFQDMSSMERRRSSKARPASPSVLEEPQATRKDSQCSDIVLLSISGRTSRLSSIGSQGSNQSRLSNASHMSILSGQSGISRCSSPHKMLLETSFCGYKAGEAAEKAEESYTGTKVESEVLEKVLLSRKHDPTEAILAEGILVEKAQPLTAKTRAEKPPRKQDSKEIITSDIIITVDKSGNESNNTTKVKSRFVAESGVEYYYIPLKGPLPPDLPKPATGPQLSKTKLREVKSANFQSKSTHSGKSKVPESKPRCKSATPTPSPSISKKEEPTRSRTQEPKYIRIKLKPDRCYPNEPEIHKPDTLQLDSVEPDSNSFITKADDKIHSAVTNGSPKIITTSTEERIDTVTPSPSISRRSSFASLFKSKDAIISPESPSVPGSSRRKTTITGILKEAGDNLRSRSRSKSRDRDSHKSVSTAPSSTESIDLKSKNKSVLSLFKGKKDKPKSESETSSQETIRSGDGPAKLEFASKSSYYENPLDCATVRIPLHSPTYYENRSISDWKTSSQDSQETVIENVSKRANVAVEEVPKAEETGKTVRQSSTSSENIVFSTKLGNDNEVFTTKLPKKLPSDDAPKVINGIKEVVELHVEEPPEEPPKIQEKAVASSVKEVDQEPIKDKRISQISEISQISVGAVSSVSSLTEDHNSSESEKDVDDNAKAKNELKLDLDVTEIERKAIVLQQDSFEDELPYVPTTLPQERSAALPIVPVKQRSTFDMKTCPIERPRSTTPINPSCLEEYCEEVMGNFNVDSVTRTIEKLRISLPRNESFDKTAKVKSPRKKEFNANWSEFAEGGIASRATPGDTPTPPPPLPPKAVQTSWINFEDIPEKRKAPKRIQTIPSRGYIEVPEGVLQESVVYSYVNPDECKCECHELNAKKREKRPKEPEPLVQEDELPLLDDDNVDDDKTATDGTERVKLDVSVSDCRSIISDSSVDLSTSIDTHEASAKELTLRTPFTSDLGLSSNRSSVASQDDHQSPESPNAFPKIS